MDQMSRDKQIDDLAEKIREIKEYITDRDGITYGERYVTVSHSERIAKHLLDAGYRKQIEGEWNNGFQRQQCSICRYRGYKSYKFCPKCGAKMKHESEGTNNGM